MYLLQDDMSLGSMCLICIALHLACGHKLVGIGVNRFLYTNS